MKDRSILVLFICIVVVGSIIGIQEYGRGKQATVAYQRIRIFNLDPATLTSMQFISTNAVVDCVKENGIWMVGDPAAGMGRADIALVYRMVAGLNSMGRGTTITAKQLDVRGLDDSEYGFQPPAIEILAVDNQGRHSWQVGRTTPLGDEVYVKEVGNDEIFTVPSLLLTIIPSDPDQLRNRVVFPGEATGIKRVEIRGPGGFIRIAKESSNLWRIQQPSIAPADPYEVEVYINKLFMLRVEDFIAENVSDLAVYGLQGESRQISLGGSDGSSRTLVLGDKVTGRPGFVYARCADDTTVFALPEDVLQLLDVSMKHFRNARVLSLPPADVASILLKRGADRLTMSRDVSGMWSITSPVAWNADAAAVANLVDLWSHAVVTDFNAPTNAAASDWVLEFVSDKASFTNRIEVLPAAGRKDGLFIRIDRESKIFQINLPMVPDSIIDPLVYKDKHVWNLRKGDVNKLVLQRDGQPKQTVELGADGTFVAADSNGNAHVDTVAVGRLLDQLCNMSTSAYIAYNPRNLEIYGLANPSLELYVGLVDSNELGRVLLVGRETADGFFSMVKGRDVVFYLAPSTVNSISTDLVVKPAASVSSAE